MTVTADMIAWLQLAAGVGFAFFILAIAQQGWEQRKLRPRRPPRFLKSDDDD